MQKQHPAAADINSKHACLHSSRYSPAQRNNTRPNTRPYAADKNTCVQVEAPRYQLLRLLADDARRAASICISSLYSLTPRTWRTSDRAATHASLPR